MNYSTENIRLFIGAGISPDLDHEAKCFREDFDQHHWLSWTKPENLHVTVFFLGSVRIEILENLISLFRIHYMTCQPVVLDSGKWVWAPTSTHARMIWIRFPKSEKFSRLVLTSRDCFSQIQTTPQQRIRPIPHITIARFRPEEKRPINLPEGQINGTLSITSLTLWRSEMSHSGVKYTPLATFKLGGKN